MVAFGRYRLREVLGEGGFSIVHRAHDTVLEREVALKQLRPELATSEDTRRRFLREAHTLARLRHRHIVRIYDVGEEGGLPYLTMELIQGETLAGLLQREGPQPPARVAALCTGLAGAIDHLHTAGIIHRDIKAANVMVEPGGDVILMDLGIARLLESTPQTHTGAMIGSPHAMSPEQVRGEPLGPASDIYALGTLAYHLLTGRPPFTGAVAYILHAHAYAMPEPLTSLRPELPAAIDGLFDAVLAKQPHERPASAAKFAEALAGLLAATSPAPPAPPALPAVPVTTTARDLPAAEVAGMQTERVLPVAVRPAPRRRRWPAVGGAAVTAGALAAALLLTRGEQAPPAAPAAVASPTPFVALSVPATGSPAATATRTATPAPQAATVTDMRVFDSVFSGQTGTFIVGASVVVCLSIEQGTDSAPLMLALTDGDYRPGDAGDAAVIARTAVADGPCTALMIPGGALAPGAYSVWAMQGRSALARAPFAALPRPDRTPAPAPSPRTATPSPPAAAASAPPAIATSAPLPVATPPPVRTAAPVVPVATSTAVQATPPPSAATAEPPAQRTPPPAVPR